MALWLKLRYLLAYRHHFAADVDREIRRRLGHDQGTGATPPPPTPYGP